MPTHMKKKKLLQIVLVVLFSVVVFFGAGLSVTYFNNDVNMQESLSKIFGLFSGEAANGNLLLCCYSFGIGIGMLFYYYCQYTLKK